MALPRHLGGPATHRSEGPRNDSQCEISERIGRRRLGLCLRASMAAWPLALAHGEPTPGPPPHQRVWEAGHGTPGRAVGDASLTRGAPAPRRDLKGARHLRWDGNKQGCRARGGEPGAEVRDAVEWTGPHRERQKAPSRPSDPSGALDGRFLCKEGGGVGRTAPHRGAANVPLPSSARGRAGGLGSRSRKCSHPARKSRAGSSPRLFTRTRDLRLSALATWASRPRRGARGRDALPGVHTPTAAPVRVQAGGGAADVSGRPLSESGPYHCGPGGGWPVVTVRTVPPRPRRGWC